MRLIAFQPTEDPEVFNLWYLGTKGIIYATTQRNIKGLRSLLMSSKIEGVELFSLTFSKDYITSVLVERQL